MNTYHFTTPTARHRIRADWHQIDRAAGVVRFFRNPDTEVAALPWDPPVRGSHLWADDGRPFHQGRRPGAGNRRRGAARRLPPKVGLAALAAALALLVLAAALAGCTAAPAPTGNGDVPAWAVPMLQFPELEY